MQVTATQAKNRFDASCAQAKTLAQRKKQFELTHSAWLAAQNSRFEAHGLWCDDLRVW